MLGKKSFLSSQKCVFVCVCGQPVVFIHAAYIRMMLRMLSPHYKVFIKRHFFFFKKGTTFAFQALVKSELPSQVQILSVA